MRTIIRSLGDGVNDHILAKEDRTDVTDFASLILDMKRKFLFELDPFQICAFYRIEQGKHVEGFPHSSAWNTVIAEYTIALAL